MENGIDWEKQWAEFSPTFKQGYCLLDLKTKGSIKLAPGPGFGDLSHPTTRLMVAFLESQDLLHKKVIDIGCGSGILSLAAARLGASFVQGVDIEIEAVEHAQANAKLNHLGPITHFALKAKVQKFDLILMNMISSEQKAAWEPHRFLEKDPATLISSGVLLEERERYLALAKSWGFQLREEKEEEGWLAFLFTNF